MSRTTRAKFFSILFAALGGMFYCVKSHNKTEQNIDSNLLHILSLQANTVNIADLIEANPAGYQLKSIPLADLRKSAGDFDPPSQNYIDPWGRPYLCRYFPGFGVVVWSSGPNRTDEYLHGDDIYPEGYWKNPDGRVPREENTVKAAP